MTHPNTLKIMLETVFKWLKKSSKSSTLLPLAEGKSYLFILPWSLNSIGGVTEVVLNLMNQMKQHDQYTPLLMVNSWEDKKIRKQTIKGCTHHFFRLRSPWNNQQPFINFVAFCIFYGWNLLQLQKFLLTNKVKAINVHYCELYAINISIAKKIRLYRGRFILSFHGKDLLTAQQAKGFGKILWKLLLRSADTIVTCSESLKNDLIQFDRSCSSRTVVIHNGVDMLRLRQAQDKKYYLGPEHDEHKIILNIATFEHKKGQDVLVKAFAIIAKEFPNVDLIIIGRPGKALNPLRRLIDSLNLNHRVWLYEGLPHDKIITYYRKATVFTLPSRYEPFGIVILEAGIFGVPVIATNVGGIREILKHDQTGRLCRVDDSKQLTNELIYLLNHPGERKRLGKNLQRHVEMNFSWKRAYLKYLNSV